MPRAVPDTVWVLKKHLLSERWYSNSIPEETELPANSAQRQNAVTDRPPVAKPSKAARMPDYLAKLSQSFQSLIHLDMDGMPVLDTKMKALGI